MASEGRKVRSASLVLSENRQSQEQHTINNTVVNTTSGDAIRPERRSSEEQARYLEAQSRPRYDQQQTEQLPQLTAQTSTSAKPTRQSRRLKQRAQRDARLNVQERPPPQTSPSFDNYNHNYIPTVNSAPDPYMTGNDFSHLQNPYNMNNIGWGPGHAGLSSFNQTAVPSALQQAQLLHIQFAQQLFMYHQTLGTVGNGLPWTANGNGVGSVQQMRSMSTTANAVPRPLEPTPAIDPNISTPGASTKGKSIRKSRPIKPPVAPIPSPSYLDEANKEPRDLDFQQPLLIILDLNGTLLYRKPQSHPIEFIRRPAFHYFLERVTRRHEIMVWSSCQPQTVKEICENIFSEVQQKKLIAKWNRDNLGLNPKQYSSKVQVYKELEKVWTSPQIQKTYPTDLDPKGRTIFHVHRHDPTILESMEMTGAMNKRWDQSNTVLIDDSILKAAGNPYNILEVPEFTDGPGHEDDTVLESALKMIKILSKSNNVSRRLRTWQEQGIRINRDGIWGLSEDPAVQKKRERKKRKKEKMVEKRMKKRMVEMGMPMAYTERNKNASPVPMLLIDADAVPLPRSCRKSRKK